MQERQKNRALYFQELATTSKKYFIPYISKHKEIKPDMHILEIGCGDGGNLLPFSELGCRITGVDMAGSRIKDAIRFFQEQNRPGTFIASYIFKLKELEHQFDIIICHDVLEHIENKGLFLSNLRRYVKEDGIVFMSFPAWQMPFGGHQQICKSKVVSHLPFIHLLPNFLYKSILKAGGEDAPCMKELFDIKKTRTSIELFEKLAKKENLTIFDRQLYFINPHYETKFGLRPRKLSNIIGKVPYIRNYFTTSCFYILKF